MTPEKKLYRPDCYYVTSKSRIAYVDPYSSVDSIHEKPAKFKNEQYFSGVIQKNKNERTLQVAASEENARRGRRIKWCVVNPADRP
jgi:hypothetical protein